MAHLCEGQGDRQLAMRYYKRAIEIYREAGDQWAISHPLCDLAWQTWDEGDTIKARELMEEHLASFKTLRANTGGQAMALGYLLWMNVAMGDFRAAGQFLAEKCEVELSFQTDISSAIVLSDSASLDLRLGKVREARHKLESALVITRRLSSFGLMLTVLRELGDALVREGRAAEALVFLEESLVLSKTTMVYVSSIVPGIQLIYSRAMLLCGNPQKAKSLACQSLDGARHSLPMIPACLEALADIAADQGEGKRAVRLLGAARKLREDMHLPVLHVDRPKGDKLLSALRSLLGEPDFRHAFEAGAAMSAGEAVEFALAYSRETL